MEKALEALVDNPDSYINDPVIEKYVQQIDQPDKISLEKYHRPTSLKPQTAASYLWGNQQNYYGDVSKDCSSLAIGSLGYNEHCMYHVWWYHAKKLEKITSAYSHSDLAYIYVESDWKGFTPEEVETLSNAGVALVSVYITSDSIHRKIVDAEPPANFLITSPKTIKTKQESNVFYFIFTVLFVIAFWLIWKSYQKYLRKD